MMAEALGVDEPYICAVEAGSFDPPVHYVERVAEYFGAKIPYLFQMVYGDAYRVDPPNKTEYISQAENKDTKTDKVVTYEEFRARRCQKTFLSQTD